MSNVSNIYLIGFSGSGKTTVAPLIAQMCSMGWIDMDHQIERNEGKSIYDIFNEEGEAYFRHCETKLLESIANSSNGLVVATGGGVPTSSYNRKLMAQSGIVIRLDASLKVIKERLDKNTNIRPLLSSDNAIEALMAKRAELYKFADAIIHTDNKPPEEIAKLVTNVWRNTPLASEL